MGKHSLSREPETRAFTPMLTPAREISKRPDSAEGTTLLGTSPEKDAELRAALKKNKAFALSLLIVAAIIFLACKWAESAGYGNFWVGLIRAGAEAGMIGGLADWFAVTALFRHPMGLKIPHTALIPNKKDQLGEALSGFVEEKFLTVEGLTGKVQEFDVPRVVAEKLVEPDNAKAVSRVAGNMLADAVRALDPDEAEAVIRKALVDKLAEPQWAPPLGRVLDQLIADGQTEPLIEQFIEWMVKKANASEDLIIRVLNERAPKWAPKFANDLIGEKIYRELVAWSEQVAADRNHEARQAMRRFIYQFSQDLQYDPVMIQRVEDMKHDVMGSKPVQNAASTVWAFASKAAIEAAEDENSVLRLKIADLAIQQGNKILTDAEYHARLESMTLKAAAYVAENHASSITALISEKVASWEAQEAAEEIELRVGKDLQYIRMNGTIVGALAGAVIYLISQAIFGH